MAHPLPARVVRRFVRRLEVVAPAVDGDGGANHDVGRHAIQRAHELAMAMPAHRARDHTLAPAAVVAQAGDALPARRRPLVRSRLGFDRERVAELAVPRDPLCPEVVDLDPDLVRRLADLTLACTLDVHDVLLWVCCRLCCQRTNSNSAWATCQVPELA